MIGNESRLLTEIEAHPYPLLFVTVSGAHLYGFPSADSDYDLRGVHLLPAKELFGLHPLQETIEVSKISDGLEIDLVTHDAKKFFQMLLKKNGYVLEQLYSPLILETTSEHEELKEIAKSCITRHHSHHYLGFAQTQWQLWEKESPRRVKPLLYVFRVLLTGIHLMETTIVEANLVTLNEKFKLKYLDELIDRKTKGKEKGTIDDHDLEFFQAEYQRLLQLLEEAAANSSLPKVATAKDALNDLLVRLRFASL